VHDSSPLAGTAAYGDLQHGYQPMSRSEHAPACPPDASHHWLTDHLLPPHSCTFPCRWLEWEKGPGSGGDPARLEHVKQRALAFVEGAAKA
jgi:hypothetical protein